MNLQFKNKAITGILTILPENEIKFDDEVGNYNFSAARSQKLKLAMGFEKRRAVKGEICVSDLCIYGLEYLFDNNLLNKEDIDGLILVTQSPDYIMPPTSNIIQGKLGLKSDMFCLDINQGCAGFIVGLFQAFLMLEQESIKKIVLLNADVLSRKVSKHDRNSNPLIGDGASITIIEKRNNPENIIFGNLKMNGQGADALKIPAGGFKMPSTPETAIMETDANGNSRSLDNLIMKGDEVFNFVQTEVPPMIEELTAFAKVGLDEIDYYIFHQPNKFMLQKLADKLGVSRDKMPNNIVERFGNSSGVSIPTAFCFNVGERALNEQFKICFAGFGVGLTWGSVIMDVGNLLFSKIIDY